MAFNRDNVKSPTFEIEGVDMEQSLNESFDPYSGIDISGSFKNTIRSLEQTNQDGRVPLGMFYFKDDNVFQDNLPNIIKDDNDLFTQIEKPNMVQNGDCKFIQKTYVSTKSKEDEDIDAAEDGVPIVFKPQGGWTFMTEQGVAPTISPVVNTNDGMRVKIGGGFGKARLEKKIGDELSPGVVYTENMAKTMHGGGVEQNLPNIPNTAFNGQNYTEYYLNDGQLTSCVVRIELNQDRRSFLGLYTSPPTSKNDGELLFVGRIYYQDEEKTIKSGNDGMDETEYYDDHICHQVEILSPHLNTYSDDGGVERNYHLVDLQQHRYGGSAGNQHGTIMTPLGDDNQGGTYGWKTSASTSARVYLMVIDKSVYGGNISRGPTHDQSGHSQIPTQKSFEEDNTSVAHQLDYARDGAGYQKSVVPVTVYNGQWWFVMNEDGFKDFDINWYKDNYDDDGNLEEEEFFQDGTPFPLRGPIPQAELDKHFIMAEIKADTLTSGVDSIDLYGVLRDWQASTVRNYPQIETDTEFQAEGYPDFQLDNQLKSGYSGFYSYVPIAEKGTYTVTNGTELTFDVRKEIFHQTEIQFPSVGTFYSNLDYNGYISSGDGRGAVIPSPVGTSIYDGCIPPIAAWIQTNEAFSHNRCLLLKNSITWTPKITRYFDNMKFMLTKEESGPGYGYFYRVFGGQGAYENSGDMEQYGMHYTQFGYVLKLDISYNPGDLIYPGGNQYRTLNQVIKIYDRNEGTLRPYSSLKISFMMKTYDVREQDHNAFNNNTDLPFNNRIDNPTFEQMPVVEAGIPYASNRTLNDNATKNSHHSQISYGDFNSFSYGKRVNDGSIGSRFGGLHKFKNTKLNVWEKMEFTFNLQPNHGTDASGVENLDFFIAASSNGIDENGNLEQFIATVLIDNIEVIESYDFSPDVDVRKKKAANDYGQGDLTKYYDRNIPEQLEAYNDTTAPLEAQFYFYPRYPTNEIFDEDRRVIYNDFKNGMFYIYDVNWGDGSGNEFTDEPKPIDENTALYHTYETSGVFEVTGYMIRMKPDEDYNPIGVAHTKRFKLKINVNEGLDEEFNYFGGDGFSFIPYKNTTPIIGGISKQSSYYKTINRQLGFLGDGDKTNVDFESEGSQVKTELALIKMDDDIVDEGQLEIGQYYLQPRNTKRDNTGEEIFTGLGALAGELGESIGDCDLTHVKYYTAPKSIFELFGFSSADVSEIGNPDLNNRRYWRNIIPKTYSIFNRDGIELDTGLQQPVLKSYITPQDWYDTRYYYPVLPRYSANGSLIQNSFPNNKIPWPLNGPITDESEVSEELLFHITPDRVSGDAISDETGNNNYGFLISDYKPKFDTETLTPQKVKSFKKIKSTSINGAF